MKNLLGLAKAWRYVELSVWRKITWAYYLRSVQNNWSVHLINKHEHTCTEQLTVHIKQIRAEQMTYHIRVLKEEQFGLEWEATLRCWFRKLKFRCRTSHFNHHNRVLIVHLLRDGRAFSFLAFLLLPNKIDGDPNLYKNHHSCSQTKYDQWLICSDKETQKSRVDFDLSTMGHLCWRKQQFD